MQPGRRPFLPILVALVTLAALAAGCGASDESNPESPQALERAPTATATTPAAPPGASARTCGGADELRVTGAGCDVGRRVLTAWAKEPSCSAGEGASRFSCSVDDGYRCLGAATERGVAVSCARPGSSIAFIAER
jgi:hypothetical protein